MGLLASVDDTCLGVVVVIRRIDGSRLAISPANCADAQSLVPSPANIQLRGINGKRSNRDRQA